MKQLCQVCGAGIPKQLDQLKEVPEEALRYQQTIDALDLAVTFLGKADAECIGPVMDAADRRDNEQEIWHLQQQIKVMLNFARRRLVKGFLAPV